MPFSSIQRTAENFNGIQRINSRKKPSPTSQPGPSQRLFSVTLGSRHWTLGSATASLPLPAAAGNRNGGGDALVPAGGRAPGRRLLPPLLWSEWYRPLPPRTSICGFPFSWMRVRVANGGRIHFSSERKFLFPIAFFASCVLCVWQFENSVAS